LHRGQKLAVGWKLGFLWYAIRGYRPEPQLEGWAWFLREHLSELEEALGPAFAETKRQFEQKHEESREMFSVTFHRQTWQADFATSSERHQAWCSWDLLAGSSPPD
jgi:hypothetical protein